MLIDDFLPAYDFAEKHETSIRASAEKISAAIDSTDFSESWIIWILLTLRGLGRTAASDMEKISNLRAVTKKGFAILGENPGKEIVLGLAGKFWQPSGSLQEINAENFREFDKKGFAKAVWNFALDKPVNGEILLKTETRIKCLDENARANFRFYWGFIKPFSGWIRLEMLRLIKHKAESCDDNDEN